MENTTTSHSSCISQRAAAEEAAASMSAGESSWAKHFAGFLASSSAPHSNQEQVDRQGGALSDSGFSSGFSSSFDSLRDEDDDDSFITSDLMCEDDDDDSLQDTACSSAAGPKVITSMNDMYMKSMVTMGTKEINNAQLAKYFLDVSSRQQATGAVQGVTGDADCKTKQPYDCNDLRKKGLCLVPLSMLIDYLG